MIRILIADDHAVVRAGFKELLSQRAGLTVVGEAQDGEGTISLVGREAADVLLLDVSMPGPPFLDVLRRVRAAAPALKILVLTMHPEDQFAARALRAGASGYMTKNRSPDELIEAVTRLAAGGRYISGELAERLAMTLGADLVAPPHHALSDRELEVLLLLGAGLTVTQAATSLNLSVKTVSTFRTRLLAKMGFTSNADIVQYVARHGLLTPPSA
ncbi:MAG: response regulator transcription factor [Gemmatimonadetes bacterium]|nr:response regulator transcription factor [Gemmatimonadota bacterium]